VDDDPEQVSFYAMVLQNAGMITSVALDSRSVIGILIESKPDLILMDLYMPGCSGLELATLIRQQEAFIGIPVVFFSVEQDMKTQLDAVRHGADDFLVKPILPEHLTASLAARVERNRRLRYFMERDSLTGLYNHSQLQKRLADDLDRSRRIGSRTCYAMIDIDHFKSVNDRYGHLTGDRVIKALSQLLLERLRKTDTVGRYGGEEFGVILFNTDINSGEALMNEIRESFARIHHKEAKNDFIVTFSCGITEARSDEALVAIKEQADKALYSAKRNGRNRVERFSGT
jgi:diguanylate cyclase (GGDEF)-like protein